MVGSSQMILNSYGLPKPGRELDVWIAEHVFGYRWCQLKQPFCKSWVRMLLAPDSTLWEHRDEATGEEPLCTLPGYAFWCPFVSSSAAFFQVMEAMDVLPRERLAVWHIYEFRRFVEGEDHSGIEVCFDVSLEAQVEAKASVE